MAQALKKGVQVTLSLEVTPPLRAFPIREEGQNRDGVEGRRTARSEKGGMQAKDERRGLESFCEGGSLSMWNSKKGVGLEAALVGGMGHDGSKNDSGFCGGFELDGTLRGGDLDGGMGHDRMDLRRVRCGF